MFTDVLQGNRSGRFSAETNAKEVLAFSHMELGNIEPARNHFQKVLEMEAQEVLRSLAEMDAGDCGQRLKAKCPGVDAVFYLRDALRANPGKTFSALPRIKWQAA